MFFPKSTTSKWRFPWEVMEIEVRVQEHVLGPLIVEAEVVHCSGAPSTALRLSDGSATFAYSGDTEWIDASLTIADGADLFVCECYDDIGPLSGHLTWEELKPVAPRPARAPKSCSLT